MCGIYRAVLRDILLLANEQLPCLLRELAILCPEVCEEAVRVLEQLAETELCNGMKGLHLLSVLAKECGKEPALLHAVLRLSLGWLAVEPNSVLDFVKIWALLLPHLPALPRLPPYILEGLLRLLRTASVLQLIGTYHLEVIFSCPQSPEDKAALLECLLSLERIHSVRFILPHLYTP